jgi:hypothetical protein
MKAMIPILLMIMIVCGTAAFAQSPPMYVPYQAPPAPQYARASAPPVQAPPVQPRPQQPFHMYDQSYRGPQNMYGQPVITGFKRQQAQQQAQPQSINNGVVPRVLRGVGGLGGYLWSYMPAPLTGAKNPYEVPAGQAQHVVNFVPSR